MKGASVDRMVVGCIYWEFVLHSVLYILSDFGHYLRIRHHKCSASEPLFVCVRFCE